MGRLIPAGTGLKYHEDRRKKRQDKEDALTTVSATEVEAALADALNTSDSGA